MALRSLEQLWGEKSGASGQGCPGSHPALHTEGLRPRQEQGWDQGGLGYT